MNSPDWLEITILLQGNFTYVFGFGGATPETPVGGLLAPEPPSRGGSAPPNPRGGDRSSPHPTAWRGVQKLPGVYIQLKQRPLNNHAPHTTISHLENDCSNSIAASFAGQWLLPWTWLFLIFIVILEDQLKLSMFLASPWLQLLLAYLQDSG